MRLTSEQRARLTLVDMINIAVSVAVLAFLGIPFYEILRSQAGDLGAGVELLLQAMVPALLIALLIVIYSVAVTGVSR